MNRISSVFGSYKCTQLVYVTVCGQSSNQCTGDVVANAKPFFIQDLHGQFVDCPSLNLHLNCLLLSQYESQFFFPSSCIYTYVYILMQVSLSTGNIKHAFFSLPRTTTSENDAGCDWSPGSKE